MRRLTRILHVAGHDLRLMVRDKAFLFWTLVFPMFFIGLFGALFSTGDNVPAVAELCVINHDTGPWGRYVIEQIKAPGIDLKVVDVEPAQYARLLVLPETFSKTIEAKRDQELVLRKRSGASQLAAARVEARLMQAVVRVISQLVLYGDGDLTTFFEARPDVKDLIQIRSTFPAGTVTTVPSGFDHAIPGTTVQFIMMIVMIYGGITVMEDRKRGVLGRMLYAPLSPGDLFQAKLLGRWAIALLQTLMLFVIGRAFFGLNLGHTALALLTLALFGLAMSALSLFLGSRFVREDLVVGLSVLLSNIFAALGGCWWPNEIVPPGVRAAAVVSPAYWAMDALHTLRFFHGGLREILPHLAILLVLATTLSLLAARTFRIRE